MTRDDLLERVAFWQVGLMDTDHLRDVAYEALDTPFDCTEFRVIAGDARLDHDDARALLEKALRAAGLSVPTVEQSERVVAVSIARSVLAGSLDPLWGAEYISDLYSVEEGLWETVCSLLVRYSCPCCNGLGEMVDPGKRARRRDLCRTEIRTHLRTVLPRLEEWAGLRGTRTTADGCGFLGWRRPSESRRSDGKDLDRRIGWVLLRIWDPIGVSHEKLAKDEYDGCVLTIRRILLTKASETERVRQLRDFLRVRQIEHMEIEDSEDTVRRREVAIQELLSLMS